jgi:rhamnosyltransferase
MISIIIRTKNEERWISKVLKSIFQQDYRNFEVIIVDNNSVDKTIDKAKKFNVKIFSIDKYLPGKALNRGIETSKGEYIVSLSAHCIPVNNKWLNNLLRNFKEKNIAGVYGRQEPMSFTSDLDKRDLLITFGLDKKIQERDSFFHNANSMIVRDIWEKYHFDETVSNIEDRVWAKQVLDKGYKIIYEPKASVYHYHGIHQDGDKARCLGVINVLKNIAPIRIKHDRLSQKIKDYNVFAFVPVKGKLHHLAGRPLIEYTIDHAKKSRYIKKIFVLTDNPDIKNISEAAGAYVPFLREPVEKEDLDEMLRYSLERIESNGIFPDIVAVMWTTFPFRENGYIDKLIHELVTSGLDSIISARPLFEKCWQEKEKGKYVSLGSENIPRESRKKMYMGIEGLGYVTYPDCIRKGKIYSENIGIVEVNNPISAIKVRDEEDFLLAEKIAESWLSLKK